jgi:hypothetical protein
MNNVWMECIVCSLMSGQTESWQLQPSAQNCYTSIWGTVTVYKISGFCCILVEASLFWDVTWWRLVVGYWCFRTIPCSLLLYHQLQSLQVINEQISSGYHVVSSVIIVSSPDVFLSPCSSCNLRSVNAWTARCNKLFWCYRNKRKSDNIRGAGEIDWNDWKS